MRFIWMGCDWSKCQSSNIWGVLNELCTDDTEGHRKVASGRKVARGPQLECVRDL